MAIIKRDSGCKVGWVTYDNKAEADAAGVIARQQGIERASRGYDFGYQSPGEVVQVRTYPHQTDDGRTDSKPEFRDEWTVTIP